MKKVKGILIIPFGGSGAVHDIEINTENLDDYYKNLKCDMFTCVDIDKKNTVFVDDEGLLKPNPKNYFTIKKEKSWFQDDYHLAGRGLVLGIDNETGETVDTSLSSIDILDMITFNKDGFHVEPKLEFVAY